MLVRVVSIDFHPGQELVMEHYIFFKCISCFVYKVYTYIGIIRVDFTTAHVYWHENRFDT